MFKFTVNPVTNQPETTFNATLVNVSSDIRKNVNETPYRLATISFTNAEGKEKQVTALVYEKNYQHGMKTGQQYLTTARITDQGVLIQMSHLQGSERASIDDFGFEGVVEEVKAKVETADNGI